MKNWLPPVSCPVERHADGAAQVRPLIELVADRVAGPAFAVAARIAALDDEVGHDAMEREAVEEPLARERDEVLDRQRRVEHGQLDLDRAAIGLDVHLRGNRRRRRCAASRRTRRCTSSAPAGSARRHRSPDRAASAASAARTRTAQSLSASAVGQHRRRLGGAVAGQRGQRRGARDVGRVALADVGTPRPAPARRSAASARRAPSPPPRARPDRRPSGARAAIVGGVRRAQLGQRRRARPESPAGRCRRASRAAAAARPPAAASPSTVASAARTLQCGSGSSPDRTVTKPSGSRRASAAERRRADRRARIAEQVEQRIDRRRRRRCRRAPSPLRAAACGSAFGAANDLRAAAAAAAGSPSRPSARIASTRDRAIRRRSTSGSSTGDRGAVLQSRRALRRERARVRVRILGQRQQRRQRSRILEALQREGDRPPAHARLARRVEHGGRQRSYALSRTSAYSARRNAAAGVSRRASASSPGSSRERARLRRSATPSAPIASARCRIADQAERFGRAALHERRRIARARATSGSRRARIADEAERERRHLPHFGIGVARAARRAARTPSRRPTRPIASAARRRIARFAVARAGARDRAAAAAATTTGAGSPRCRRRRRRARPAAPDRAARADPRAGESTTIFCSNAGAGGVGGGAGGALAHADARERDRDRERERHRTRHVRDDIIGSPCTSATSRSKVRSAPARRRWPSGSARDSTRRSCSRKPRIRFSPTSTPTGPAPRCRRSSSICSIATASRRRSARRISSARSTISDYLFDKDKIFAYLNLDDNELFIYQRLYDLLARDVPPPDLVVYLQAPTDVLLRRLRSRAARSRSGRASSPTPSTSRELNEAYHHFFFHYNATPLLVVETSQFDSDAQRRGARRSGEADPQHGRRHAVLRAADKVTVAGRHLQSEC